MTDLKDIRFQKMHGLGNDFVIIDGRENGLTLTLEQRKQISDRQHGVGCDQLIIIERSDNWAEMNFMRIYNPDGSEAEACGNATRCLADLLMREDGVDNIVIETVAGSLNCWKEGDSLVRVEMGKPNFEWQDIPLSEKCDTDQVPLELEGLGRPVAVNIGNPHCVYFLGDNIVKPLDHWEDGQLKKLGAFVETHALFPQKTNVEFVQVLSRSHVRMRVWERAAGVTQACGSGACGAAVAAIRRGLTDRKVTVTLDGGDLTIEWPSDDALISMTGPISYVFEGKLQLP